jgi:hypothetical protein
MTTQAISRQLEAGGFAVRRGENLHATSCEQCHSHSKHVSPNISDYPSKSVGVSVTHGTPSYSDCLGSTRGACVWRPRLLADPLGRVSKPNNLAQRFVRPIHLRPARACPGGLRVCLLCRACVSPDSTTPRADRCDLPLPGCPDARCPSSEAWATGARGYLQPTSVSLEQPLRPDRASFCTLPDGNARQTGYAMDYKAVVVGNLTQQVSGPASGKSNRYAPWEECAATYW